MKDFERALEGLQNFDEENEIGLFDDDDWIEHLEEIKAQYDSDDSEEDSSSKKKTAVKKVVKKEYTKSEDADEADDEEEDDDEEKEEEENDEDGDEFGSMDRVALKKYITANGLEISVKKSMSDDDLRNAIRAAAKSDDADEADDEEEDDETEEEAPAKVSLSDIRKKLAGK